MHKCLNKKCGTYWLNPRPLPDEVLKLYDSYSTHTIPTQPPARKISLARSLLELMRKSIHEEYGYKNNIPKYIKTVLVTISHLHPGWRNSQLNQILYVPFVKNGKLLDVGCGNGSTMKRFQELGFTVSGTDFDSKAIEEARKEGLNVHLGDLQEIAFPKNTFDVVFLSHVIEHVPNPVELLVECRRILKPNGFLIALTPNANSSGHQKFKHHWRGLEIPRHLQVFTPASLAHVAAQSGFMKIQSGTCMQGIHYLWNASKEHAQSGSFQIPPATKIKRVKDHVRLFGTGIKFALAPGREETLVIRCQK